MVPIEWFTKVINCLRYYGFNVIYTETDGVRWVTVYREEHVRYQFRVSDEGLESLEEFYTAYEQSL